MSEVSTKSKVIFIVEILGWPALLAGILLPLLFFNSLPDKIPVHYNFSGHPDDYGSKITIWALPLISAVLFALLHLLSGLIVRQKPKPKEDPGQFFQKLQAVQTLLVTLKTILAIIFTYIVLATIMIAPEKWAGLGWAFTPLVLGCTLVLPLAFAIRIGMMK
jgi:uncharacterized membrane protein